MSYISEHFKLDLSPVANPDAVVTGRNIRFTVITSRLIRIEISSVNKFEDRASQVFWHRNQPVPPFQVINNDTGIEIITEDLHLVYKYSDCLFPPDLHITGRKEKIDWHFGEPDKGNLFGTARTLDEADGSIPLGKGLLSADGWSVVDDTDSLVFDEEYMPVNRGLNTGGNLYKDIYFFGYGRDYKGCLRDFFRVSGNVPLIPRWALGNWWCRYWEYTQEELTNLMQEFEQKGVPLSVCIVDMDWHIVRGLNYSGWTGYTWNTDLFPNHTEFLKWLHDKGLKVSLNLHPAEGVRPHEKAYEKMAEFMGIDPATRKSVDFDIADPRFIEAYFEILHHPLENEGIDFWWIDWQQGTKTKIEGLDPLWMLNHLHFCDSGRSEARRPFIFSRWGGLGSHRYPIGFSGDTLVTWKALAFQPYFTFTASNVGFGWWSHDIGGHMGGVEDRELYTRWIQFGAFSPILRLHSSKNLFHRRLPWEYDDEVYNATKEAMQLRHALIPYLYSMAWKFSTEGLPPITPMYYNHPDDEMAYQCLKQYYFGTEMVVSPFVSHTDEYTGLSRQVVWLPEGGWFDFNTGEYYEGGTKYAVYGTLKDIPVFAKAGAIVPLAPKTEWGGVANPTKLQINIFPGKSNIFTLYEDDGESQLYKKGKYCTTDYILDWNDNSAEFEIRPAIGDTSVIPGQREYELNFISIRKLCSVKVEVNGKEIKAQYKYDDKNFRLLFEAITLKPADHLHITVGTECDTLMEKPDLTEQKFINALMSFKLNTYVKREIYRDYAATQKDIRLLGRDFIGKMPPMDDELKPSQLIALSEILKKREILSLIQEK